MINGRRTIYILGLSQGFSPKFLVIYLDQQTPDNNRRAEWPKRYPNNNKDEFNNMHGQMLVLSL